MGRGPIPLRQGFPAEGMRSPRGIGHYPGFPRAIPVRGAGRPRVTHPFAADPRPEGRLSARLACVRRAASVHPEPGSNSPFERRGCPAPRPPQGGLPAGSGPRGAPAVVSSTNLFRSLAVSGSQGSPRPAGTSVAVARGSNIRTPPSPCKGVLRVHNSSTFLTSIKRPSYREGATSQEATPSSYLYIDREKRRFARRGRCGRSADDPPAARHPRARRRASRRSWPAEPHR